MTERVPNAPLVATTLQALIDEEQERTANARDRLGTFVPLGQDAIALLNGFVASIGRDHFLAAATMLAIQKAATLSFLSYIRSHIAQAEFNARQVVEFTALAAYLIAHPEEEVTRRDEAAGGGLKSPKALSGKAYKWLDREHRHHSALLLEMKNMINDTASHASMYLTHFTFDWDSGSEDSDVFRGSFFDAVDDDVLRLYLMSFARLIVIVVDLIRAVAERNGGFTLKTGMARELGQLDHDVNAHRDALGKRMNLKPAGGAPKA